MMELSTNGRKLWLKNLVDVCRIRMLKKLDNELLSLIFDLDNLNLNSIYAFLKVDDDLN